MGNAASASSDEDEVAAIDAPTPLSPELQREVDSIMTEMTVPRRPQAPLLVKITREAGQTQLQLCWTDIATSTPRVAALQALSRATAAALQEEHPGLMLAHLQGRANQDVLGDSHVPSVRGQVMALLQSGGKVDVLGEASALQGMALSFSER